jgi:hypothetical protein
MLYYLYVSIFRYLITVMAQLALRSVSEVLLLRGRAAAAAARVFLSGRVCPL